MKQIIAFLFIMLMCLLLSACSIESQVWENNEMNKEITIQQSNELLSKTDE